MKQNIVRLIVRSRRIPVRVEDVTIPYSNVMGASLSISKRIVIYDYALDQEQERAFGDVRELARQSGLRLEIIDLTREKLIRKLSRKLGGLASRTPQLILCRELITLLGCSSDKVKSGGNVIVT